MMALSATAGNQAHTELPGYALYNISPDGRWAMGGDYWGEAVVVLNTETGEKSIYYVDADDTNYSADMAPGNGNCISNDGVVLVSTSYSGCASYIHDGEITALPVTTDTRSSFANGITPDGSRICGNIGAGMSTDDIIMQTPVIWDRNDDGTYAQAKRLPYPTKDFSGRTPQYIFGLAISDDGKTVAAQMIDYSGTMSQLFIYTEDEDGNWSYDEVQPELLHPEGITFPEYPGEGPAWVSEESYMTAEEIAAYSAALEAWYAAGTYDYSTYPEYADFMTDEEREAYNSAYAEYVIANSEWSAKFFEFLDVLDTVRELAPHYSMNNVMLSGNGRYLATTDHNYDFSVGTISADPFLFDLQTGKYYDKHVEGKMLISSYVSNDGVLLASEDVYDSKNCMVSESPESGFISFNEWVSPRNGSVYTWMDENMKRTALVPRGIDLNGNWTFDAIENVWLTGVGHGSGDMSKYICWVLNVWEEDPVDLVYSYVLDLNADNSGINDITLTENQLSVAFGKDGVARVCGEIVSLEVYDINGRLVFNAANPGAEVATGLTRGLYIVKATAADGTIATTKATL